MARSINLKVELCRLCPSEMKEKMTDNYQTNISSHIFSAFLLLEKLSPDIKFIRCVFWHTLDVCMPAGLES